MTVLASAGDPTTLTFNNSLTGELSAQNKLKLVIVDDNEDFREMIIDLLGSDVYHINDFNSAPAALKHLEKHSVDLLITDYSMPEMNGGDFVHAIRQLPKMLDLPIIMVSGYMPSVHSALRQTDGIYFLEKPFKIEKLFFYLKCCESQSKNTA
jgi:CheY-like chemotaxis protein